MQERSRKLLLLLIGLTLLGVLFFKFRNSIHLEGFRWALVGESLRDARWSLLLLSILSIYVCYAIRSLRWMRLSRALGQPHFTNTYAATLMGFAALFLLGRVGEPVRPVLIGKKDSLPIPGMFGVYVVERVLDSLATTAFAAFALLVFRRRGLVGGEEHALTAAVRSAGVALLVALAAVIAFLAYFRVAGGHGLASRLELTRSSGGWRAKLAGLLAGFFAGLQAIRTWGDLVILLIYTAVHWFLILLVYLWVAHSFGGDLADLDFAGAVLLLGLAMIGSVAQLPGVGGGSQVVTFLVFTRIFGVENEPAATAAVVLWLVTFASCSVVGLPLLLHEGWSMGKLRRLAIAETRAEISGGFVDPSGKPNEGSS